LKQGMPEEAQAMTPMTKYKSMEAKIKEETSV
jgi:hypothetical protein